MSNEVTAAMIGIWLPFWAIRRTVELDYRLNRATQAVRWAIIALSYTLGSVVSLGRIRAAWFLLALVLLCWPNFAYHLSRPFQNWPTAKGTVESSEERSSSRWFVTYYFEFGGQTYGGTALIRPIPGMELEQAYPEGRNLTIRYDPMNPGKSSTVERNPGIVTG